MLAKIQRNWITHILLVGKKNGIANPEKIFAVPFKTKNGLNHNEHLHSWAFISGKQRLTFTQQ